MTAETAERTALRELEQQEAAIDEAAQRVEQLEAEKREADAKARRTVADLEEYYRQLGAGQVEPDPEYERRLKAAVEEVGVDLTLKGARTRAIGDPAKIEAVNQRLDSMLDGARQALATAEQEYDLFIRSRLSDLVRELRAEAEAVVEKVKPLWSKIAEANDEWWAIRKRWGPLIERSNLTYGFPESPFGERDRQEIDPPIPKRVLEGKKVRAE